MPHFRIVDLCTGVESGAERQPCILQPFLSHSDMLQNKGLNPSLTDQLAVLLKTCNKAITTNFFQKAHLSPSRDPKLGPRAKPLPFLSADSGPPLNECVLPATLPPPLPLYECVLPAVLPAPLPPRKECAPPAMLAVPPALGGSVLLGPLLWGERVLRLADLDGGAVLPSCRCNRNQHVSKRTRYGRRETRESAKENCFGPYSRS